jgi:peptidoglycan/xylan/chitin deacetylase (PgdA/CDA1 family)
MQWFRSRTRYVSVAAAAVAIASASLTAAHAAPSPSASQSKATATATATATSTTHATTHATIHATIPPVSGGLAPVLYSVPTTDKVVFLTADDGYTKDPATVAWLAKSHVPLTPFLAMNAIADNPSYFKQTMTASGQVPQDHSLTHPFLTKLSYAQQKHQICGAAKLEASYYGVRPWLFRPPFGAHNQLTLKAASACGMRAVMMWDVSLPHAVLRYANGPHFRPGDILLIHWRTHMVRDLIGAIAEIHRQGFTVAALQDYIPKP